jgi:multisite-specific tRNA:(cytosine-C5)-methyltransferase
MERLATFKRKRSSQVCAERSLRFGWLTSSSGSLQLRILLRAMKMLKPGGQVVYSTCSLNPVENEAVLAAALNKSSGIVECNECYISVLTYICDTGQFELADLTDNLPLLQRRPGMKKWSVPLDKTASKVSDSYESYREGLSEKEKESSKIFKTMFVPPNVEELGLERWYVSSASRFN